MIDQGNDGRLSRYLAHLASVAAGDPTIHQFMPMDERGNVILALVYADVPMRGYVTGFTYGLSLSRHADWLQGGRELSLTVQSIDTEWGKVPSRLAASLQGRHPFKIGQAIGYVGPLVEGSAMNSVLLAEPVIQNFAGRMDLGGTELGEGGADVVELVGVYPIYASEREFVYASGFDVFWGLEWDRLDPSRNVIV